MGEYLEHTVFYRPRPFNRQQFKEFMLSQSTPFRESLALIKALAQSRRYLMAALNNESRELNLYRLHHFDLQGCFTLFLSSCFVGLRKPAPAMYQRALDILQQPAETCLFIDDRPINLEAPRQLGIQVIHFQNTPHLIEDLASLGVSANTVPAPPLRKKRTAARG